MLCDDSADSPYFASIVSTGRGRVGMDEAHSSGLLSVTPAGTVRVWDDVLLTEPDSFRTFLLNLSERIVSLTNCEVC